MKLRKLIRFTNRFFNQLAMFVIACVLFSSKLLVAQAPVYFEDNNCTLDSNF